MKKIDEKKTTDETGDTENAGGVASLPPPAAPKRRPVEEIATERGMLPAMLGGGAMRIVPSPGLMQQRSVKVDLSIGSKVAPRVNPEFWKFAAAKAMHRWPQGAELTDEEFNAAVNQAIHSPNF